MKMTQMKGKRMKNPQYLEVMMPTCTEYKCTGKNRAKRLFVFRGRGIDEPTVRLAVYSARKLIQSNDLYIGDVPEASLLAAAEELFDIKVLRED